MVASVVVVIAVMLSLSREGGTVADETTRGLPATPQSGVSTRVDDVDALFSTPYDWQNLRIDERGRYVYLQGDAISSRAGIDVSEHQGEIDWQRVAADGIDFAIIRVGCRVTSTGALTRDAYFERNLQGARDAGIDVGVYFYSLATTVEEADEEAAFTIDALAGVSLEYPVVFDIEPTVEDQGRLQGLDKDKMTAIAQAFCERVEAAGYRASVYGNQTDLSRYHLMQLTQYGFWYAQYDSVPTMSLRFALWQYTQRGEVDGIDQYVDLDLDLIAILNAPVA